MRFFLASFHMFLLSGAYPDASCVGVRYCVCSVFSWEPKHLSCVFGEAVAVQCDSCQLEMCFLLQQPVERSSSHSSGDHPKEIIACIH